MILFFYGPNTYASRQKLRTLIERYQKTSGSSFGLERFDLSVAADETWIEKIISAITSIPFLAAHRLVVIENMLSKSPAAAGAVEQVLPALKRVPDSTVVVFYEQAPDERTKGFKALKTLAKTVKFDALSPSQLVTWIRKTAQELGGSIHAKEANYLIEQAGTDQWNLYNQLNKLVNFNPEIDKAAIDELVEPVFEKSIFDLTEALLRGNTKQALAFYQGLRLSKAEPLYILSMIGWSLRNLLIVKSAGAKSASEISKQAGMNPYVVNKSKAAASQLDINMLSNAYKEVVDTDLRLKTSAGKPDLIMEELIIGITSSIKVPV